MTDVTNAEAAPEEGPPAAPEDQPVEVAAAPVEGAPPIEESVPAGPAGPVEATDLTTGQFLVHDPATAEPSEQPALGEGIVQPGAAPPSIEPLYAVPEAVWRDGFLVHPQGARIPLGEARQLGLLEDRDAVAEHETRQA